ncbi:hypothetical protein TNCV_459811 [Trichonephila clavipes]|nr:hypothetical protein TNCV_459811 [Trichonephila clavipes]
MTFPREPIFTDRGKGDRPSDASTASSRVSKNPRLSLGTAVNSDLTYDTMSVFNFEATRIPLTTVLIILNLGDKDDTTAVNPLQTTTPL